MNPAVISLKIRVHDSVVKQRHANAEEQVVEQQPLGDVPPRQRFPRASQRNKSAQESDHQKADGEVGECKNEELFHSDPSLAACAGPTAPPSSVNQHGNMLTPFVTGGFVYDQVQENV